MIWPEAGATGHASDGDADVVDRTMEALEELVATVSDLVSADSAVLLLRDEQAGRLAVAVRVGASPGAAPAAQLPLAHPLAERLLKEPAPAVADLAEDADLAGLSAELGLDGLAALCAAPMRTLGEELMGVLLLGFSGRPGFRPADLQVVGGSARQAAEIVERARLHAEARTLAGRERRHSERLRLLADAVLAISRESAVEDILKLVTEAACDIIGARWGVTTRLDGGGERTNSYEWSAAERAVTPSDRAGAVIDGLTAPLVARDGGRLGVVELGEKTDGTAFNPEDAAMLVQLAQMASVSIENAELIRRERSARRAAEESARLRGLLSDASAAFAASLDLEEVLSAVTSIVVPEFADWCGVSLLRSDGEIQLVAESSADDALLRAVAALRERMRPSLDRPHGVGAVIRTGESEFFPQVPPELLAEVADEAGLDPRVLYDLRIESGLVVPLPSRGRPMGALTLIRSATPEPYTHDDLAFAEDLGARAALAIDNATRFTLERQAADMLQRSLLPRALPRLAGLQAAARYLPGGAGTRIGGDWYDVIALDEGRLAFVVGDVMGRGIPAATVMGQVRSAVRAYAQEGHGPARVLALTDQLVERLDDLQLTTCVYGVYDSADGTFTVASAGHPAPLLLGADGSAVYLDVPPGLPLGAGSLGDGARQEHVVRLPQGSTLLLYTDGLVEARDCPIDEGMRRLQQAALRCPEGPELLCDTLLKAMGRDGHHDDDTALLALSVTSAEPGPRAPRPPTGGHRLEEGLRSPGVARRIVVETLAGWGIEDPDTVVLLTHELVTNAVLHGGDPIVLRLERRGAAVRVEVADGSQSPPALRHYHQDAFTGRGLALVEALAGRWGWQLAGHGKVVWCEVDL